MGIAFGVIELLTILLLIIGTVLIWQGFRGRPQLTEPRCRGCGYDVRGLNWMAAGRLCPECGSDLSQPDAVRFGKYKRRPRRMIAGAGVFALGILVPMGVVILQSLNRSGAITIESNASIIANLATTIDQPWDWQKLEDRYRRGQLPNEEAADAVDQFIAHLQSNPGKQGDWFPWLDGFFKTLLANDVISAEQLERLLNAYYGPSPEVRIRTRISQGKPLSYEIGSIGARDLPGIKQVLALREVTVDGEPVEMSTKYHDEIRPHRDFSAGRHDEIKARITTPLSPGKHEIRFEFDRALLPENAKIDPRHNGRPGQADIWPTPLVQQSVTTTVNVNVLPEGEPAVSLMTEPAADPAAYCEVTAIDVIPRNGKLRLEPKVNISQGPVPLYFRIKAEIGGELYDLGYYGVYETTSARSLGRTIPITLAPDVITAKVILEPAPDLAEEKTYVNEIWGKPVIIESVPLERWDLKEENSSGLLQTP
jgi:hypothetical protein